MKCLNIAKLFLAKNEFEPAEQAMYQLYFVNTDIALLPDIAITLLVVSFLTD